MGRKIEGYKLDGYNATYDEALFDVRVRYEDNESCVLEILEINSGVTFIFEVEKEDKLYEVIRPKIKHKKAQNTYRSSRKQGPSETSGSILVTFGSASRDRKHSFHAKRYDKSMPGCDSESCF